MLREIKEGVAIVLETETNQTKRQKASSRVCSLEMSWLKVQPKNILLILVARNKEGDEKRKKEATFGTENRACNEMLTLADIPRGNVMIEGTIPE